MSTPTLIVHVVYRFAVGGLENGVVNLINRLPRERFRHAVVSLTDVDPRFAARMARSDVNVIALDKSAGHAFPLYPRLFRLFRKLRPDIIHTRNLAALEAVLPAWVARVPVRLHSEHGWDVGDVDGANAKHRLIRLAYRPFVDHYVALSQGIERYLRDDVRVPAARVTRIINGVDTERFAPARERGAVPDWPFARSACVLGTVGRLAPVKNQTLLARAFVRALEIVPALRSRLRLAIVGDGSLRTEISDTLARAGASDLTWLPGSREDIADILQNLDVFVLPSIAEGISNTILEAMATGLPVVATNVGGNAELVADGATGLLVPPGDVEALARGMLRYADAGVAQAAGRAARERAETLFSLEAMIGNYSALYERLLNTRRGRQAPSRSSSARGFSTGGR
jgi:sugar transferase (PEP-CTERM/EpsH1 system associated)